MPIAHEGLIVIGENLNATRKIKGSNPRITKEDDRWGLEYIDRSGMKRLLDVTDACPEDPKELADTMIPHVAQCFRNRDLRYLETAVDAQVRGGAHIIDVCVDEMSPHAEERIEWMRWLVPAVQRVTDVVVSIDSSDPLTIEAGLRVHDGKKSRPFINAVSLEEGRDVLLPMAKEYNAYLAGNASGRSGMPYSAQERVDNLVEVWKQMDGHGIPMEDCFLDPLVFPVGAGPDFGSHYLEAVKQLREMFPKIHIFGGHSNVSFGLPNRRLLGHAFVLLSVVAGCDTIMIDPTILVAREYLEFKLAAEALVGRDEYSMRYLAHYRRQRG